MSSPTAVVLLAHGSPDPDWRQPLEALADRLRTSRPDVTVRLSYLGFLPPDFATAVTELREQGHRHIQVLAAFLSPGGKHIKKDVPALVAEQAALYPDMQLELRPGSLGAEPEVVDALARAAARALDEAISANANSGHAAASRPASASPSDH